MSKIPHEPGFIYIYPVIQGSSKSLCKIGVTNDFKARMNQHVRTPYQGFTCVLSFPSYKPIATAFRVKYMDVSDNLVRDYFQVYQLADFEVYDINYNLAIQELYNLLYEHSQFLDLIQDKVTDYGFLVLNKEVTINTTKSVFEDLKDKILSKYKDEEELPNDLLLLLREEKEFAVHCSSHYTTGNFVRFRDGLVLDIGVSKPSRALLLNKLQEILKG